MKSSQHTNTARFTESGRQKTDMELRNLTGKQLTDKIRQSANLMLAIFLPSAILALLLGIFLVIRFRLVGAVIGTLLLMLPIRFILNALPQRLHPERADVFRKYGTPDEIAERIRDGSNDIFFDNGRLVCTEQYLLDKEKPETLLFFPHALNTYPDGVRGREERLIVYDSWGQKLCYPFTNGKQQVFRIDILTDKIRKLSPECRNGHRPEDLEYVRQHAKKLPDKP